MIKCGVPKDCAYKSDQWVALSALHASEIVAMPAELYGSSSSSDSSSSHPSGAPDTRLLEKAFGKVSSLARFVCIVGYVNQYPHRRNNCSCVCVCVCVCVCYTVFQPLCSCRYIQQMKYTCRPAWVCWAT